MKIFSNKKTLFITIVLVLIGSSSISIIYFSINNQSNIDKEEKDDFSNLQKNIPTEILDSAQIFDKCDYDMHCVVEQLSDISKKVEKPVVIDTFSQIIFLYHEKQVNSRCHSIAHHLGEWIYGYTKNLDESFQYADPLSCGGGIYHGIFENYFSVLRFENAKPDQVEIRNLCTELDEGFYSLDMAHCLHGLGHGLLLLYDYDVFNAVKRCEDFDSIQKQDSCANGIFMQNVLKNYESGEGNFDQNNILFPCDKIISRFAPTCYIWHGTYILKQRDFEVYSSFRECDNISQEFIKYCYYGIGTELESDAAGKMELALLYCQAGKIADYHQLCFRGMAMKTSLVYLDSGFKFCSLVPEKNKEECYDGLGYWIKLRYDIDEKIAKECSKAENSEYFEVCMHPKIDGVSYL
jgi:hypothetical protein